MTAATAVLSCSLGRRHAFRSWWREFGCPPFTMDGTEEVVQPLGAVRECGSVPHPRSGAAIVGTWLLRLYTETNVTGTRVRRG